MPSVLKGPYNMLEDITVMVEAADSCGPVVDMTLVSITYPGPSEGDDIAGAEYGTLDLSFQLRAVPGRVYTVTYQATDALGNRTETPATVTVTNLNPNR